MKRLTKKEQLAGHTVNYVDCDACFDVWSVPKKFMGNAIDRLAAYEDTKLEPEEIKSLQAEYAVNLKVLESYRSIGSVDRLRELAKTVQVVLIPQDVLDGGEAVNSVSHKLFWYTPYIKAIIFSDVIYSTTGKLFFLGHPFHTHSSLQISA